MEEQKKKLELEEEREEERREKKIAGNFKQSSLKYPHYDFWSSKNLQVDARARYFISIINYKKGDIFSNLVYRNNFHIL